jgi:hypothetical protein
MPHMPDAPLTLELNIDRYIKALEIKENSPIPEEGCSRL